MNVNNEYCNPFNQDKLNIWMKIEHCGRYLWASDKIAKNKYAKVIDAACADGYGAYMIAKTGCQVLGLDCNKFYLDIANSRYSMPNIHFLQMDFDIDNYPISEYSQDFAICFETIEHVNKPRRLIEFLYYSLKYNGTLLLSFPNAVYERFDEYGNNRDPYHKHVFAKEEILDLLVQTGFVIHSVLGQPLCNMACQNQIICENRGWINEHQFNDLFFYNEKAMNSYARVLGYPSDTMTDCSYSYIIEAIKQ